MGRPQCDMVVVAPKADFVTRLDSEFVAQLLGNHDLALRTDTMSHTSQYNLGEPVGAA